MNRRALATLIGLTLAVGGGLALAPSNANDEAFRNLARRRADLARKQLRVIERAMLNPPLVQEPQGPRLPGPRPRAGRLVATGRRG